MNRTPTALITVATAMSTAPSRIPLAAPDAEVTEESLPMIWKPDQTSGSYTLLRVPDCRPPRAILYARVSRCLPQTKSTTDQLAELRQWATREQWQIVGEFSDDGISASRYANGKPRPAWSSVVDVLAGGGADVLACWEFSRASRDRAVNAALLAQCIDTGTLIATGGRLHDPDDADDAFMLDLTGSLA
ncbi:MAG: recombinase family protein, partial [Pseudonocardiales bacterium]|nr:recombinase family protein [Pseudonocardiales bacterium]